MGSVGMLANGLTNEGVEGDTGAGSSANGLTNEGVAGTSPS